MNIHIESVLTEVKKRWDVLTPNFSFPTFNNTFSDKEISDEFHHIHQLRQKLWFDHKTKDYFKLSEAIVNNGLYRVKSCISFSHSKSSHQYNCSTIPLKRNTFLALEGPKKETTPLFFSLLKEFKVNMLISLTSDKNLDGSTLCYPYWKEKLHKEDGQHYINYDSQTIAFLHWDTWIDSKGVQPDKLLKLANTLRKNQEPTQTIAVHCSAGVGRTGTLILATMLLNKVDDIFNNKSNLSINKFSIARDFLYLNFFRPWFLATEEQYITVYRMVQSYIKSFHIAPDNLTGLSSHKQ